VIVVPAELVGEVVGVETVWRVLSRGVRVVGAECGVDGSWQEFGHHRVDGGFCMFDISAGELVAGIVADEILLTCQWKVPG